MKVYAKEGEWVTCSGAFHHQIAMWVCDVVYGDPQNPKEHLAEWTQQEPEIGTMPGDPIFKCKRCGHLWWNGAYHIEKSWRK